MAGGVEVGSCKGSRIGERRTGYQSYSSMVRHTELSPTGSETSGTDRQSESVAAIIGPITHLFAQRRKSSNWRTPDRNRAVQAWLGYKHPVQCVLEQALVSSNFLALIGNPRSLQQLVGQLPICCCSKAKKVNDFSRAGVGVCVSGRSGRLHTIKQWRRIATRYDKLAATFLGFVKLARIMLWLK
jgi:hypothetical protein